MKISVIIPMYNASLSIRKCLYSVLNQTFAGELEVIVVNDGSTDKSLDIVNNIIDNQLKENISITIINQKNSGVSKARNVGMMQSTGKLIALLDSDDEWLPRKIERQVEILNDNNLIDFLGCSRNNENLKILGKEISTLHKASVNELLIKVYPQTSTAIFKRELFEKFGGYNEQMTHGEDANLWVRYCANSNFYYSPESLVFTGDGKPSFGHSGLSANLKAMQRGSELTLKEARLNRLISLPFYYAVYAFSKVKYIRRIIITSLRKI
ncbi:glycosyltransferase family 2 protein [Pedobacter antarcticus]|nr:glycosyltransferase family A protein [Pedobacter antarcticus]